MHKCTKCNKEFDNYYGLNSHMGSHNESSEKEKLARIYNGNLQKERKLKRIEEYNKKPKLCIICNNPILYDKRINNFCSHSCSAKFSNVHRKYKPSKDKRTKIANCKTCNKEIEVNIRAVRAKCKECNKIFKYKNKICIICGNEFKLKASHNYKTCSKQCKCALLSHTQSSYIAKNGKQGFHNSSNIFNYKHIKDIQCDSKLEMASVIYLVDVLKADTIERYRNILNFWDNDIHRAFNPDFFVRKNNKVYIVEVKMIEQENTDYSNYNYYRYIPLKKEALIKYCNEHNYELIWLDFNYDKEFKRIYDNFLKLTTNDVTVNILL